VLKLATLFPFPLCVDFPSAGTPIPIAATNATVANFDKLRCIIFILPSDKA
jgi:hypothetical protein